MNVSEYTFADGYFHFEMSPEETHRYHDSGEFDADLAEHGTILGWKLGVKRSYYMADVSAFRKFPGNERRNA